VNELIDNALELGPLFAECFAARLVAPDIRIFEIAVDLLETFPLAIEVKDTPSGLDLCPASP
jgi:hypothetical protein